MLRKTQMVMLTALGVALWILVTLNIKLRPEAIADPLQGSLPFVLAPLAGWLSVWLCRFVGKLSAQQLLPGVALVGAVAMMLDGAALKWFSGLYGFDERILRLAAAGLLWGYGVAFVVAIVWAARLTHRPAGATAA